MSLALPPEPNLNFQELVDKVRKDIITYCPEWTDYNVSDPGITLIELFAWMTTMLGYRIDQSPRRNQLKFLELLGTKLYPPEQAHTKLTFYLSTPFPLSGPDDKPDYETDTQIERGIEVASRRAMANEREQEIIFSVDKTVIVSPPRLIHVRRDIENDFDHNYLQPPPTGENFYDFNQRVKMRGFQVFQETPRPDDAFYLGFVSPDEVEKPQIADISGYYLRLDLECQEFTGGIGIDANNPPLVWECGMGDEVKPKEKWQAATCASDETGGLNKSGAIELHLPLSMRPTSVHGIKTYWLRCRVHQRTPEQKLYQSSPSVKGIKAFVKGITVPAVHSARMPGQVLGESSGDSSQSFTIPDAPFLPLDPKRDEFIQVEEEQPDGTLKYISWQEVDNFAKSRRDDKHYTLDIGTGEVRFGPSVRRPNGTVRQYGAVPPLRRKIRVTHYRKGGGTVGNVPRNTLRVLKQSISYIVDVTNWEKASGGTDPEDIERAIWRTLERLETQQRAVTASDYEQLARRPTFDYIARLKCKAAAPNRPGEVILLVVPNVRPDPEKEEETPNSDNELPPKTRKDSELKRQAYSFLAKLAVDQTLKEKVRKHFDEYRVLGTILHVKEPIYRAIKLKARIQSTRYSDPDEVRDKVIEILKNFITPLSLNNPPEQPDSDDDLPDRKQPAWEWPFEQNLYNSDIYTRVKTADEVKHIINVQLFWCDLTPIEAGEALKLFTDEEDQQPELDWQPAEGFVKIPERGLFYLLEYDIEVSPDDPA